MMGRSGVRSLLLTTLLVSGVIAMPNAALAANGDCAQPLSDGNGPSATDCLLILRVAVGLKTCEAHRECVCAPKGSLPVTATDALVCLNSAVGGSSELICPCGCVADAECDDGEPCNGFEQCVEGACSDGTALGCDDDDLVILVPFMATPDPVRNLVEAETAISRVDAYLLLDRADSVSDEVSVLKSGVSGAVSAASCFPIGTGQPPNCVQDLYAGVGWIGYGGTAGQAYRNRRDLQPDPNLLSIRFPTSEPAGCCNRTTLLSLWSTATGKGNLNVGCSVGSTYGINASCSGSAAGDDGIGYPCFRPSALRAVVLVTDEQPSLGHGCPSVATTVDASVEAGVRIVSLYGGGTDAGAISELESLATSTGAVDANDGDSPLVFDASGTQAPAALTEAIIALATGTRLTEVSVTATDDAGDGVDATQLVESFATAQLGTAACPNGLFERDTDSDGIADAFLGVPAGTPLCWTLQPATNQTVAPAGEAQVFRATISIDDTGFDGLYSADVYFVVPPAD